MNATSLTSYRFLGCRQFQHQHLDDCLLHDHWQRSRLVARLALRLDRLQYRCLFHLLNRPHWCDVPHLLPSHVSCFLRHLGCLVACFQPCGYGLCLVRRAIVDWWGVRDFDDQSHREYSYRLCTFSPDSLTNSVAIFLHPSQRYSRIRHEYSRLCWLFHFLGWIIASDLVPGSQDPTSLHREGLLRSSCRHCFLWLGYR